MTYGAIAWAARDFSDKDKKLLRKTNRIAANIMITPKKSTPSSKLEIILDIKPLDIKAQERALSTWARLGGETLKLDWDGEMKQRKRKPLGHRKWLDDELQKMVTGEIVRNNRVRFKKLIFRNVGGSERNRQTLYADGACKDGWGSIGVVQEKGDKLIDVVSKSVGSKCTPFLAELCAIREAVKQAIEAGWKNCKILTDSKWAIHDIQRQIPSNTISRHLKQWLMEKERITLEYTRAHAGNAGNERADHLAKLARGEDAKKEDMVIGLKEVNETIESWGMTKWEKEATKEWRPSTKYWEEIKKLTKAKGKYIIEWLTGHGNFRDLMIKKKSTQPRQRIV